MPDAALPELVELERVIDAGHGVLDVRVVREVEAGAAARFPIYAIALGNPDTNAPAVGFVGGVHGLERIGTDVVVAYLRHLVMRLRWDATLHRQLESVRLLFMPLVNPGGMWRATRANPNGVDLMRNAPLEAHERVPPLIGGHRISAHLPWFRGHLGDAMEVESAALCKTVAAELLAREFSIALDCHSGFGLSDRIWFPYAHTREPFSHLAEVHALEEIFRRTHPHHPYIFEPQSLQYLAHGDLWDYLHLRAARAPGRIFLPLTLEMGAWLWVKKNPRQMFSKHGIFNPRLAHRQQRVLRRHLSLLDFLSRAAASFAAWIPRGNARAVHAARALDRWYR
ncbi:M14 family metallopeptidase [Aromatoleum aromaticum]|uniref:Carboxypeptidase n=1 Tax=Aromatoleum aromaticum (strain DSM 19018 / LMG 30748 / EbN1) TaxID=76114 RepID=Q5P069_AROAE|nr:M14 family metallopeptidase [Aromatoleum aromaticum]NMG56254.1 zinc carboxypeptidase [Aromatoleum aromaticum]CAI09295.1 putative carboxypeptidase [Aromatoleum aromaticum EbN1]